MNTLSTITVRFAAVAVLAASLVSGFGFTAQKASAAAAQTCYNNTGATSGAWNNFGRSPHFAKGGWCMHYSDKRLVWQNDGNLVLYQGVSTNNHPLWASNTNGRGQTLVFQGDGNIVIYDASGKAVWADTWDGGVLYNAYAGQQVYYTLRFQNTAGTLLLQAASGGSVANLWVKQP